MATVASRIGLDQAARIRLPGDPGTSDVLGRCDNSEDRPPRRLRHLGLWIGQHHERAIRSLPRRDPRALMSLCIYDRDW